MTEKIDFSQLANEDDTLISWEDLFPEYAIGGESFKSGQKQLQGGAEASSKQTKTIKHPPNSTPTLEQYLSGSSGQKTTGASLKENAGAGVQVMDLSELPDIPSLTDDFITIIPEDEEQQPTVSQKNSLKSTPAIDEWAGDIYKGTFAPPTPEPTPATTQHSDIFNMDADWISQALADTDDMFKAANNVVKDQDYWAARFNQLNFAGMDLMAVSYFGLGEYDLFEQHMLIKRVARDFVRLLSYNYTMELRSAGVSEEGIFYMKKGKIPENFTVHLKYPLEYGGKIDFSNMVFMQDKPFHDMIHSYLDEQMMTPTGISYPPLLYVPTPVGKIYVPFGMFTGSGGKNKQDRSVYAGYSKAAFDKIALKAMPGR